MENTVKILEEKGYNIALRNENGILMANATEMATSFGDNKSPGQWLRLDSSKEYIQVVSDMHKCTSEDLLRVRKGGKLQGTWMHEDVAMEFARWLSPEFALWCNKIVKEYITSNIQKTLPSKISYQEHQHLQAEVRKLESKAKKARIEANICTNGLYFMEFLIPKLSSYRIELYGILYDKVKAKFNLDLRELAKAGESIVDCAERIGVLDMLLKESTPTFDYKSRNAWQAKVCDDFNIVAVPNDKVDEVFNIIYYNND